MANRAFSLSDQLLFSATNFVLTLALARIYSTSTFGIYGLASSFALLASGFQKSVYVIPLSLGSRFRIEKTRRVRTGEHIIFLIAMEALVCALALGALLLKLDTVTTQTCITLIGCCAIFLQADFDRALLIKLRSPAAAAIASLLYFFCVAISIAIAHYCSLPFFAFIGVFAGLCIVKALIVMRMTDAFPNFGLGRTLLRRNMRHFGIPALVSTGIYAGMNQVPVTILAAVSGVKEVAIYVAMRSLAQPFLVIIRSLDANDKNRFIEHAEGTYEGMRAVLWKTLLLYVSIGIAATLGVMLFTNQITHLAFNDAFPPRRDLVGGWLIYCTLLAASMPIQSLTYVLHRQQRTVFWNLAGALCGLVCAVALSPSMGAFGTLIAMIAGMGATVIGGLFAVRDVAFGSQRGIVTVRSIR